MHWLKRAGLSASAIPKARPHVVANCWNCDSDLGPARAPATDSAGEQTGPSER